MLCRCSPLIFNAFPSVIVCYPDFVFCPWIYEFEQRYTTVAFIYGNILWGDKSPCLWRIYLYWNHMWTYEKRSLYSTTSVKRVPMCHRCLVESSQTCCTAKPCLSNIFLFSIEIRMTLHSSWTSFEYSLLLKGLLFVCSHPGIACTGWFWQYIYI